jgi:hypothetical protein
MVTQRSSTSVSRRAALAGLGAGGAGLAVAASTRSVHAEGAAMAAHPLAGAWLVSTSPSMATAICTLNQDGTALVALPVCEDNGSGTVAYTTPGIGTWQSEGSRGPGTLACHRRSNRDAIDALLSRRRRRRQVLHRRGAVHQGSRAGQYWPVDQDHWRGRRVARDLRRAHESRVARFSGSHRLTGRGLKPYRLVSRLSF